MLLCYRYDIMSSCWSAEPVDRPDFTQVRERLKNLAGKLPAVSNSRDIIYINTSFTEDESTEMVSEGPLLSSSPSCSRQITDTSVVTADVHESTGAEEDDRYVVVISSGEHAGAGAGSSVDAQQLNHGRYERDSGETVRDVTEMQQTSNDTTHLL